MPNSSHFKSLNKRIGELEKHLIPPMHPTGQYTPVQIEYTRGFVMLAHAAIEFYFEEYAKTIVNRAHQKFNSKKRASRTLVSLSCFTDRSLGLPPHSSNSQNTSFSTGTSRISSIIQGYLDQLKKNNGIREKNILQILLPLGIEINDLDPLWLTEIDNFGKDRGLLAHKAATVYRLVDPQDELARVYRLLAGIKLLDEKLVKIT